MKELDTKLDELKKIYIKKPTETINELNQVIIKLNYLMILLLIVLQQEKSFKGLIL